MGIQPANGIVITVSLIGNSFQKPADEAVGVDVVGPGVKVQDQSMSKDRVSNGLDVVEIDMVLPAQDGARFGTQHQKLRSPRTGAIRNILMDCIQRLRGNVLTRMAG